MRDVRAQRYYSRDNTTLISYYQGSYGPTLRIDTQTLESLLEIENAVRQLSGGILHRFALSNLSLAAFEDPLIEVTLRAGLGHGVEARTAITARLRAGKVLMEWKQTPAEWEDAVGLIAGLRQVASRGTPAHHYLTDESRSITIVEISFGE